MIYPVSHGAYRSLYQALAKAVSAGIASGSPKEQRIVYELSREISGAVDTWNQNYNNWSPFNVECNSFFLHQRPYIVSPGINRIEIGDLLLVQKELGAAGDLVSSRAILMQAKNTHGRDPVNYSPSYTPGNREQWDFYATWPSFNFVDVAHFGAQCRDVTGLDLYDASRYLLLECGGNHSATVCSACNSNCHPSGRSAHCCAITAYPTQPELSHYRCFISEVVQLIFGNAGKLLASPVKGSTGWKDLIDDLDRVTGPQLVPPSFLGQHVPTPVSPTRGCYLRNSWNLSTNRHYGDNGVAAGNGPGKPTIPGEDHQSNDDTEGFSIIEFVVTHKEPGTDVREPATQSAIG